MKFFEAKTKTLSHSYLNLLCRFKCSSLIVLELFCLRCRYWISYSKSKCYLLSDSIQLFVFLFVSDWIIDSNIIWANKVSHWHLQRYESNLRLKFLEFHWTRNFFLLFGKKSIESINSLHFFVSEFSDAFQKPRIILILKERDREKVVKKKLRKCYSCDNWVNREEIVSFLFPFHLFLTLSNQILK